MGGQYKVEGVVLRRRSLGEADDNVTLLSPTRGRFDAVARGIRKSKHSASGRLEPFNHVQLLVACGRSLDIISQAQIVKARPGLVADLDRVARGLYVLELYDRVAEADSGQGGDRLFRSLLRALDELEMVDVDLACRRAELRLLTVLGVAPQLDVCVHCGETGSLASFSVESGGMVCARCGADEPRLRRVTGSCRSLLQAVRAPRPDLAEGCWKGVAVRVQREAEGLLCAHLDWHWPTRVRSRRFVETLRADGGPC